MPSLGTVKTLRTFVDSCTREVRHDRHRVQSYSPTRPLPRHRLHPSLHPHRGQLRHHVVEGRQVRSVPQATLVSWLKEIQSQLILSNHSPRTSETRESLHNRDVKLSWTLFSISFCYVALVGPMVFCSYYPSSIYPNINLICHMIYFCEVSIIYTY